MNVAILINSLKKEEGILTICGFFAVGFQSGEIVPSIRTEIQGCKASELRTRGLDIMGKYWVFSTIGDMI